MNDPDTSETVKTVLPKQFRMPKPQKSRDGLQEGMLWLDKLDPYKHQSRDAFVRGLELRAEELPRGSRKRREALLVARFYKVVSPALRFEHDQMIGPLKDIQSALRWFRDKAKYKLTEEQEAILLEVGLGSLPPPNHD